MNDPILYEREGAVAHLVLNRPDSGNAINVQFARCLHDYAVKASQDPAIRCVVVRGVGRMFCAGGDINSLFAAGDLLPQELENILIHLHPAISALAEMAKPVITAVHGPAAGAGVGLAAVGDIVLAEPQAHFTLAYSHIGLTPDAGATWLLPRLIGLRRAQELALTNRRVSAAEAAEIGLITRVVDPGSMTAEVDNLADQIVRSAVGAIGLTKRLLHDGTSSSLALQLLEESKTIIQQSEHPEARYGIGSFSARQVPDFSLN